MSYYRIGRLIILVIPLFYCFLFHAVPLTAALTEEQRIEIEKLRLELSEALAKEEEQSAGEKDIIIQPEWTQKKKHGKHRSGHNPRVSVSDKDIDEIKRLRDEINHAVEAGVYAPSVAKTVAGDPRALKQLERSFQLRDRGREALEFMLSADEEFEYNSDAFLGASAANMDSVLPNIVESDAHMEEIDVRKLQSLEFSKRRQKEMLILKYVKEDFSFTLGEDVLQWAHIQHNGKEYFVGRRINDLILVWKDTLQYEQGHVLVVGAPITYLETYSYWSTQQQQQEGVILVATADKVLWFRGRNDTIQLYWEWQTGRPITGLTHFKVHARDYLAISTNQSSRSGFYSLNLYEFDLGDQEFWIAQRLQMKHPCVAVTIHDTGRDIVLALPQQNTAALYLYNPRAESTDSLHFQLRRQIDTESIEAIAAFRMGGRSYLALGGLKPQILVYQQGDFVPKTVFSQNFGVVELFLPIPVRTYRDDLILLVQHRVDFSTHNLTVLETLIWNGDAFEKSMPVPCHIGDHTVYGVGCMLDIQRAGGLKGAELLVRGDQISIIVPRYKAESGLFDLHTELLEKNSDFLDLQEIYAFMQDWVQEQDELVAQAQQFLAAPLAESITVTPDLSNLEELKTPEFNCKGEVSDIYVNEHLWTEADAQVNLDTLIHSVEQLGHELLGKPRHRRDISEQELTFEKLDFDVVDAGELWLDTLNEQQFYIKDGVLEFNGTLLLRSMAELEDMRHETERDMREIIYELDGDLEFDKINGLSWQELESGLVFTDQTIDLAELEVMGEVLFENELQLNKLNEFEFPEDFLWQSDKSKQVVRAVRNFLGTLAADSVETMSSINARDNEANLKLAKSISTKAHISKRQDEALEELDDLEEIPIPTLFNNQRIEGDIDFSNLELQGPLIFTNTEGMDIDISTLLRDIVQRPATATDEISIFSTKQFSKVEFPIDFNVEDGAINEIPIDQFVTVHTKQDLDINDINGYVFMNNLSLSGNFDNVNITELNNTALKIDEPLEAAQVQLNFVDAIENASKIAVQITLNTEPLENYQTIYDDINAKETKFDNLHANTMQVDGGIMGTGKLNGLHLADFMNHHVPTKSEHPINIYLQELDLRKPLQADQLHGIETQQLQNFLTGMDEMSEMVVDGKIHLDRVTVSGDVQVNRLNGQQFDEDIQLTAIWLQRQNYLSTKLTFKDYLTLAGPVHLEGTLNGENLSEKLKDMVFRNGDENGYLSINVTKNFLQPIYVQGNTDLKNLNDVPLECIAFKNRLLYLNGSLSLKGNLHASVLGSNGSINAENSAILQDQVRYDEHLGKFLHLGIINITLEQPLEDLTVKGDFNQFDNLSEFFQELVYKNDVCLLKGNKTFTGRVRIDGGIYVRDLNDYNMLALFDNLIFIDSTSPANVTSPITFDGVIYAQDVNVQKHLETDNLNDCSLQQWLNDTLRMDRDEQLQTLTFAAGSMDGNTFNANSLNDINMEQIITLNTPQNLTGYSNFSKVYLNGEINTQGDVNNADLQKEYGNTLMITGNQHITTPLTLPSTHVLQTLRVDAPINGNRDLNQVALLNQPLELRSPLFLENIEAQRLFTNDLVSGFNLDDWHKNALWQQGRPQQYITGNWSTRTLAVKLPPSNLETVFNLPELRRSTRSDREYNHLCRRVTNLLKKQNQHSVYIKYLKESAKLELKAPIAGQIKQFAVLNSGKLSYLMLNIHCHAYIYKWLQEFKRFEFQNSLETGTLRQFIALPRIQHESQKLEFIALNDINNNCSTKGLSVWKLYDNSSYEKLGYTHYDIAEIYKPFASDKEFYALDKAQHLVYAFSTLGPHDNEISSWALPTHMQPYRILPVDDPHKLHLINTEQIYSLDVGNSSLRRTKRAAAFPFILPSFLTRVTVKRAKSVPKTLLLAKHRYANATHIPSQKLTFSDFKQLVEHIIEDLIYRLNIEMNITQLSIPESDLYDEHLVPDFLAIMEQLQKQHLYPATAFEDIDLKSLDVPVSPAQALAARTVQIIWPVIVEIEEIHGYLRENETHVHPNCEYISESLVAVVHDVLVLAYKSPAANVRQVQEEALVMTAVIHRIQEFQKTLRELLGALQTDSKQDYLKFLHTTAKADQDIYNIELETSSSNWAPTTLTAATHTNDSDILLLQVGLAKEQSYMTAFTTRRKRVLAGDPPHAINIFSDVFAEELFQVLAAHYPRALATLRIKEETLLAFIEDCCLLRVLIYRGVQGFVEFAQVKLQKHVFGLVALSLPVDKVEKFYFTANLGDRVVFYEVITSGVITALEELQCD